MRSEHVSATPSDYIDILRDVLTSYGLPEPELRLSYHATKFEALATWPCGREMRSFATTAPAAAEGILNNIIWRGERGLALPEGERE